MIQRRFCSILKAQLNPHFLFNSLNNIFALTSIDLPKGRESIIKLSDALRYMLYKTDTDRVPLKSEIEYLSNYIELEKLRLESVNDIHIKLTIVNSDKQIAPLILLPFVENCFKHCDKATPEIEIKINVDNNNLRLMCKNNKAESIMKEDGGVGMTNAKKRLELIYENGYELKIGDKANYYKIELTLDLNA